MGCDCMTGRKAPIPEAIQSLPDTISNPQVELKSTPNSEPSSPLIRKHQRLMSLGHSSQIRVLREPITNTYRFLTSKTNYLIRAEYISTGQLCVLKVISKNNVEVKSKPRNKLRKDAKEMYELDHPNLPRIFEILEDQENFYIAAEAMSAGELSEYVKGLKKLKESFARTVMSQVLSAVSYCHGRNLVSQGLSIHKLIFKKPPTDDSIVIGVIGFNTLFRLHKSANCEAVYQAPESIQGNHTEKSDIWSCGVILYLLLSKTLPFTQANYVTETSKGRRMKVAFPIWGWKKVSEDAKSLLSAMLLWDADDRPTAAECLQHAWFTIRESGSPKFNKVGISLTNIASSVDSTILRDAVKQFIILRILGPENLNELSTSFKALDTDGDGQINQEELTRGLKRIMPEVKALQQAEYVMTNADRNRNGLIDYSEFLMSSFGDKELLTKENLRKAFNTIDRDESGAISAKELRKAFCIEGYGGDNDKIWNELMADVSDDGEITFQGFQQLMLKHSL